jgi:hypothetical protein
MGFIGWPIYSYTENESGCKEDEHIMAIFAALQMAKKMV